MKHLDHLTQREWQQAYETLRQEAQQAGSRRGHGLALFLSRGMLAWLDAVTVLTRPPEAPTPPADPLERPAVVPPELTAVLANMVWACLESEAHVPLA